MSNTFNINRFGKLFRKHTVENYKGYLMAAVVLIGILSVAYGFLLYMQRSEISGGQRFVLFYSFYIMTGSVFTSTISGDYSSKERAISYMALPVSHLERFLISWFYSFVIFSIVFVGCFYLVDTLMIRMSMLPESRKTIFDPFEITTRGYYAFYLYAFFHSIVLYGAFYFKKLHFVRTVFVFFCITAIVFIVNKEIMKAFIPENIVGAAPFVQVNIIDSKGIRSNIFLSGELQREYLRFLLLSIPCFLWIATFFQIKEKQV